MSQLHLLVVVDSETGEMHVAGMDEAPVDSNMAAWDTETEEWRDTNEAEVDQLISAASKLTDLLDNADRDARFGPAS